MKNLFLLGLLSLFLSSCWLIVPPTPVVTTQQAAKAIETATASATPRLFVTQTIAPTLESARPATNTIVPGELASLVDLTSGSFANTEITSWKPEATTKLDLQVPVDWNLVINKQVAAGLTYTQRAALIKQGFVVIHSQEDQFSDIRLRVSEQYGQPYFLTTDAAFHALHLQQRELVRALEREELRPRLVAITQALLAEALSYYPLVQGTELEQDTLLAAAYLAVGLKLLDPQSELDPLVENQVINQVEWIMAGEGAGVSPLIQDFSDDRAAYTPTGHYKGNPELESYFRAMAWFGRPRFKINDSNLSYEPSRTPLILTLALRHARQEGVPLAAEWAVFQDTITYLLGPSINTGPVEYSLLMDQVYGTRATIVTLQDEDLWRTFLAISLGLPSLQPDSGLTKTFTDPGAKQSWSLMGQHKSPDALIMQSLIYENVGTAEQRRDLPSGLDIMAALDSPAAIKALEEIGETNFNNYPEQMDRLRTALKAQDVPEWLDGASSTWLYTYLPQLDVKAQPYPVMMNNLAWNFKELNSALGSWAELLHDTAVPSRINDSNETSEMVKSGPAPGYVEPNPLVFYRLSYLAGAIADGLSQRGMVGDPSTNQNQLSQFLEDMKALGERYQELGDIAAKELQGQSLTEDDFNLIQSPLGALEEEFVQVGNASQYGVGFSHKMPLVAVISTAAESPELSLQVGTGKVDRIYVVVPFNDELWIAQGGVFSYFEFPFPSDERLTDRQWRNLLTSDPPDLPSWSEELLSPGGNPVDELVFRPGDMYRITIPGGNLNLRQDPTRKSEPVRKLTAGELVMIVDGPVHAEGFKWWKLRAGLQNEELIEGWAVENPYWYRRAY